jgi:hypothetical protein
VGNDERCAHGRGGGEASERWIAISCVWERRASLLSSAELTKDLRQENQNQREVTAFVRWTNSATRVALRVQTAVMTPVEAVQSSR